MLLAENATTDTPERGAPEESVTSARGRFSELSKVSVRREMGAENEGGSYPEQKTTDRGLVKQMDAVGQFFRAEKGGRGRIPKKE
eukprot:788516-Rhodomonas_salina.1